jgi:hypothetical protein
LTRNRPGLSRKTLSAGMVFLETERRPSKADFSRRFLFSRWMRFRVSHAWRKCWEIPSVFHFSILFPTDTRPFFRGFLSLDKFEKAGMPFFSKNTRPFGPTYCRSAFRMPETSALQQMRHLAAFAGRAQDAAATLLAR